jgi:hypothetical protein
MSDIVLVVGNSNVRHNFFIYLIYGQLRKMISRFFRSYSKHSKTWTGVGLSGRAPVLGGPDFKFNIAKYII